MSIWSTMKVFKVHRGSTASFADRNMKFHEVQILLVFKKTLMILVIMKFIFMVLYVNDILEGSINLGLLRKRKEFLPDNVLMKDLGDVFSVIGIEIHHESKRGSPSQQAYIQKVLHRFKNQTCSLGDAPIAKGDTLNKCQCPENDFECEEIKKVLNNASPMGILMYAHET
ncbi:hypothetical protein RJ640_016223 [Escallonia rubra]|uniref:Reverse transcriptase Ty1/copia-type domain-containing protein n=1 Tax=Escallonia rubra TaxID=112253 RepID=A0AA88QV41_9ASTE|nr:hypothetical protein RJ640_016223 [Escallonia rubra]